MSKMIQQLFSGDVMSLPVLGLLLFVGVFLAAVVLVARRGRGHWQRMAELPLDDDDGSATPEERR